MIQKQICSAILIINSYTFFSHSLRAADITVPSGGNLQAAIYAALPGDSITLAAGAVFTGQFFFPEKTGSGWITVRSSGYANLPPFKRVSPAQTSSMAILQPFGSNTPVTFGTRSHHWKLVGLEIRAAAGVYSFDLLRIGDGSQSSVSDLPHDISVERCYIHGDTLVGTKRGIALNGRTVTVRDSYISNIFSDVQETQGILGWNGPGPFTIENNRIEAAGLGIMFGAVTPAIPNLVPSDINVSKNYFLKPLAWKNKTYVVKHHFELKNGRRVVLSGNVMENTWHPTMRGTAIQFTVRTEAGTVPWAVVEDVKVVGNIIKNAGNGFTITGFDDSTGGGLCRRILIQDNLLTGIDEANSDPAFWGRGGFLYLVFRPTDVRAIHNTVLTKGLTLVEFAIETGSGFRLENNVLQNNVLGIYGAGVGSGTAALNAYQSIWSVKGNLIQGGLAAENPVGNSFPTTLDDVRFINQGSGDYAISSASPYSRKATDGKDPGANMVLLKSLTSGVVR